MAMKVYPFRETVDKAHELIRRSSQNSRVEIFQQWVCVGCGSKQTMEHPNTFFTQGRCEECDRLTNIEQDGCNYAIVVSRSRKPA
jgi:hypothetical protein